MNTNVLGIDFGGVIAAEASDRTPVPRFPNNPPVPGALETIQALAHRGFGTNIHIVSKVSVRDEEKVVAWLERHRFFELTGMPKDHVWFCRERREKAPICERLGISHFVDNQPEVLFHMTTVKHRFLFCPKPEDEEQWRSTGVVKVNTWRDIVWLLRPQR